MRFGPVPLAQAQGAILAHSLHLPQARLRKGRVLSATDVAQLAAFGLTEVIVAQPAPDEIGEDEAARALACALLDGGATGLRADEAFTGRVNLRSTGPGVLQVDAAAIGRINAIDPAVTLATLPPWQRVAKGMMVATVKIIPYAVTARALEAAVAEAPAALRLVRPVLRTAGLVVTHLPGGPAEEKAIAVTRARLEALDVRLAGVETAAHETAALAEALRRVPGEIVLILTASATSDEGDVGPAGLRAAGGTLTRFGMPVDPGNLLFLGALGIGPVTRPVIGLPGCARAPALNGADWVMERVICGIPPTAADIAAMGVGGLLKEIPTRPQPRARKRPGSPNDATSDAPGDARGDGAEGGAPDLAAP